MTRYWVRGIVAFGWISGLISLLLLGVSLAGAQVSQEPVTVTNFVPTGACTIAPLFKVTNVGTYQCVGGVWTKLAPVTASTGLSGMTAGQVPVAATANTVTSSKPVNGAGAGLVTGPVTATAGDIAVFTSTTGGVVDGAIAGASVVTLTGTQTLTNKTVDGVAPATFAFLDPTSSVQTQLNAKAPTASPTFTGVATAPTINATTAYQVAGATAHLTVRGTYTTTSTSPENFTLAGVTDNSYCTFSATSAQAATDLVLTYWTNTSADTVQFNHGVAAVAGDVYSVICTVD